MLIAEFTLSSPILRDALGAAPGTTVEIDRIESGPPARVSVLARGQDMNRFEDALGHDASIEEVAVRARGPAFGEYEMTLTPDAEQRDTSPWWQEQGVEPLSVTATSRGWELRMRFPSRDALSNYRDVCRDRDLSFTLHDLYVREELPMDDEHGFVHERPGGAEADEGARRGDESTESDSMAEPNVERTPDMAARDAIEDD